MNKRSMNGHPAMKRPAARAIVRVAASVWSAPAFAPALAAVLAPALAPATALAADAPPQVQLSVGALTGIVENGVRQFRGIPYAEAPVGERRWAAPQPAAAWQGVRDASRFGDACPQPNEPFSDHGQQSEDCLSLNVYVPPSAKAGAAPRPVIVWIPGGGQALGSARQYDASHLALATDAVIVTVNYRLGALGWLWTSGMAAERRGHNFAFQDQQEALRWVQRHIAGFQGDPGRITLAGESVGSISVSTHLVSPTAAGLFHRVIMASGITPPGQPSSAKAAASGDVFAGKVGCPAGPQQMSCLRAQSPQALIDAAPKYGDIGRDGLAWQSFIDGEMITSDVFPALSKGRFNKVPVMVGSTRDEGRGFEPLSFELDGTAMTQAEYVDAAKRFLGDTPVTTLLTDVLYPSAKLGGPNLAWSQFTTDGWFACQTHETAQRASGHVPVYAYEFADRTAPEFVHDPFMAAGAFHAADLLYWFQTPVGGAPLTLNPAQTRLSDQMIRYWKRFAESGQPNEAGGTDPAWTRYNRLSTPYLSLAPDDIGTLAWGGFQRAHQCGVWSLLYELRALGAV